MNTSAWIVLAHLLRPQGRKGELLADLFTDFPERFTDKNRVFLAAPGYEGDASGARAMEIAAHWLPVGKNAGRVVLQFAGVESISAAETLAGLDVIIPEEERAPLSDDSVYVSELVGCSLFDGSTEVGVVEDVQFALTSDGTRLEDAAPLLAIRSGDEEILIPFAKAYLVSVDTEARRIEMALPEGLLEVNRNG